jgi:nicotinamide mononucleotide (NMN) deamidase PncC
VSTANHQELIERIHASGKRLVLSLTGGGSGAIAALLEVPGASASVLEAIVPYAAKALEDWLGGPVDHYCSERTARAMAMAAFERARSLASDEVESLRGIGATASLATTRPKRGAHRIHVAWQSAETTAVASCELEKGRGTRIEEEQIATQLILQTIADACGVTIAQLNTDATQRVQRRWQKAPATWSALLLGDRTSVAVAEPHVNATPPAVIFPGAFNPLHAGHKRMAVIAAERNGQPVTFELSITNVDKPPLDFIEIADRLAQLKDEPVLLTRAATFVEKSKLAPGCVFIVGTDTLQRIGDPKYYGGDLSKRDAAIDAIAAQGCRFLAFGRTLENQFRALPSLKLPTKLLALCDEVPASTFRDDVSSTKLRAETPQEQ